MSAIRTLLLIVLAISAVGVVRLRDPLRQTVAISYYGIVLGVLFFAFQAPDVALSQIVIGAVILPLMALLCIGRVRAEARRQERESTEKREAA